MVLSYIFYHDSFQWVHVISIILSALVLLVTYMLSHKHLLTHVAMEHLHYHKHTDGHHNHTQDYEKIPEDKWHSHSHTQKPMAHKHPYFPDLHHRHTHE